MSSIVARQHRLYVGQSPFAHNFLVLLDDDGNRIAELHGLPVNAKGEVLDKGRSSEGPSRGTITSPSRFFGKDHTTKRLPSGRPLRKLMTRSTVEILVTARLGATSRLRGIGTLRVVPSSPETAIRSSARSLMR